MAISHTDHRFLEVFSLVTHGVIHRAIGGACGAFSNVSTTAIDFIIGVSGVLRHDVSREDGR